MNCSHKRNTIRYLLINITLTILAMKRKKINISPAYSNTMHLPIFDLVAKQKLTQLMNILS